MEEEEEKKTLIVFFIFLEFIRQRWGHQDWRGRASVDESQTGEPVGASSQMPCDKQGTVETALVADVAVANKCAQEAQVITGCWHNIRQPHRGHRCKLDLILIRRLTIGARRKLDTEFLLKIGS